MKLWAEDGKSHFSSIFRQCPQIWSKFLCQSVVPELEFCNSNLIRNSNINYKLKKKNGISMRMCVLTMLVILFRMNNVALSEIFILFARMFWWRYCMLGLCSSNCPAMCTGGIRMSYSNVHTQPMHHSPNQ